MASKYSGQRNCAYDIGVGSGILSFLLAKTGFEKIIATDSNPNAIESVQRDIERFKQERGYLQKSYPFMEISLLNERNEQILLYAIPLGCWET